MGYNGLVRLTTNGPRWTGEVRVVEHAIAAPLSWSAPRKVFVNSMSVDGRQSKLPTDDN
jgi:protein gp37